MKRLELEREEQEEEILTHRRSTRQQALGRLLRSIRGAETERAARGFLSWRESNSTTKLLKAELAIAAAQRKASGASQMMSGWRDRAAQATLKTVVLKGVESRSETGLISWREHAWAIWAARVFGGRRSRGASIDSRGKPGRSDSLENGMMEMVTNLRKEVAILEEELQEAREEVERAYAASMETSAVFQQASESLEKQLSERNSGLEASKAKLREVRVELLKAVEKNKELEEAGEKREKEIENWKESTGSELKKMVHSLKREKKGAGQVSVASMWWKFRLHASARKAAIACKALKAEKNELESQCVALALAKSRREGAMSSLVEERSRLRESMGESRSDKDRLQDRMRWAVQAGRLCTLGLTCVTWGKAAALHGFSTWKDTCEMIRLRRCLRINATLQFNASLLGWRSKAIMRGFMSFVTNKEKLIAGDRHIEKLRQEMLDAKEELECELEEEMEEKTALEEEMRELQEQYDDFRSTKRAEDEEVACRMLDRVQARYIERLGNKACRAWLTPGKQVSYQIEITLRMSYLELVKKQGIVLMGLRERVEGCEPALKSPLTEEERMIFINCILSEEVKEKTGRTDYAGKEIIYRVEEQEARKEELRANVGDAFHDAWLRSKIWSTQARCVEELGREKYYGNDLGGECYLQAVKIQPVGSGLSTSLVLKLKAPGELQERLQTRLSAMIDEAERARLVIGESALVTSLTYEALQPTSAGTQSKSGFEGGKLDVLEQTELQRERKMRHAADGKVLELKERISQLEDNIQKLKDENGHRAGFMSGNKAERDFSGDVASAALKAAFTSILILSSHPSQSITTLKSLISQVFQVA